MASLDRFPIGFWNYTFMDMVGPECVRDWADCGMTVAMSPEFVAERDSVAGMRAILDAAAQRDIKVIVCDHRGNWWRGDSAEAEVAYRHRFAQVLKDFGDHPAVFGFFVGDEPDLANLPNACKAYVIQKEMAPHLSPFLNLDCWHWGTEETIPDWPAHLDGIIERAKPDMLAYDCYSQMGGSQGGIEKYFRNLRDFQAAAARHHLPLWVTQLSVGLHVMRCPREDDLRWQVNTALAHGANGLLWFFFYMRHPHDNFRLSPIDEHGERTETFHWLSRVLRTFLKWHAPVMRNLTLRRAHHVGQSWASFPPLDGTGLIRSAEAPQPLIVSLFADRQDRDYVAVVNNSQTTSAKATLTFSGRRKLYRVAWGGKEEEVTGAQLKADADSTCVSPWLAPGQMELYRVGTVEPS